MRRVLNLGALVTVERISADTKHHYMSIGHAHRDLGVVIQRAHAVNTFWDFHGLQQIQAKLVVDKDAAVAGTDEYFVHGDHRAVHLPALNVEGLDRVGGVGAEDVYVVLLVVHEEDVFSDGLDVLHLVAFDPMNVCRCLVFLVKVLKFPDVSEVFVADELVGVLGSLLNFVEDLDVA